MNSRTFIVNCCSVVEKCESRKTFICSFVNDDKWHGVNWVCLSNSSWNGAFLPWKIFSVKQKHHSTITHMVVLFIFKYYRGFFKLILLSFKLILLWEKKILTCHFVSGVTTRLCLKSISIHSLLICFPFCSVAWTVFQVYSNCSTVRQGDLRPKDGYNQSTKCQNRNDCRRRVVTRMTSGNCLRNVFANTWRSLCSD